MWNSLYDFIVHNQLLNSNFFVGATTLFVGYGAYFLYKKQKRDLKKDAATILLAEIKSASTLLPGLVGRFKANDQGALKEGMLLLPSDSWSTYKYLFVNDLKPEEWQAVNAFYKNCLKFDDAVRENDSYFAANTKEIWVNIHKNYLDRLSEYFDAKAGSLKIEQEIRGRIADIDEDVRNRIAAFTDTYIANSGGLAGYEPLKPVRDATSALNEVNKEILLTSVGKSLEKIANPRRFFPWNW